MKIYKICLAFLFCVFSFNSFSQTRWSAEFRPGLNFPTENIAGASVSTGFGFDITIAYNFIPALGAYAGWGWNEFRADEELGSTYLDLDEKGYVFGLQLLLPLGDSGLSYMLKGGGIYTQFALEDIDSTIIGKSGYGLGWQLETGIDFMISTSWSLRPGIRYRAFSREMDLEGENVIVNLNYFSIGLGLAKRF